MPGTVVSRAHNLSPRPCATSTQATKRGGLPCGSLLPNGKLLPTTNHPRPSIRPNARRSGALCSTHLRPTARRGPNDQGLQLKVATAGRRSTKKTTIRSTNGVRIEGRVMVHRTDIAGGSVGQTSPANDCMRRRALKWRPPRKQSFVRSSARFSLGRLTVLSTPHDGSPNDPCRLSRTPDPLRH